MITKYVQLVSNLLVLNESNCILKSIQRFTECLKVINKYSKHINQIA